MPYLLQLLLSFYTLAAMLSKAVYMVTIFSPISTLQLMPIWLSSPLLKLLTSLPKVICKSHNAKFNGTTQRIWASSPLLPSKNILFLKRCHNTFVFLLFFLAFLNHIGSTPPFLPTCKYLFPTGLYPRSSFLSTLNSFLCYLIYW